MSRDSDTLTIIKSGEMRGLREQLFGWLFFFCASVTILATFGIIFVLLSYSIGFFFDISIYQFLTGTRWSPSIKPNQFGVLPLVSGTLLITVGSGLIALPTGVAAAIYLSEFASSSVRSVLKPLLEILAGIPTVVYGYFALVYITPILEYVFPSISTFNPLSACIVVGIMIIPFVSSVSEDAMSSVPNSLREASYGMGATKYQTTTKVVLPAALSGIISSFILGLSRAIGETMAVTIAAGMTSRMVNPFDLQSLLLDPIQTMTAAMVNLGSSDVSGHSLAYQSLFAVGLTLFAMTFVMNIIGEVISSHYREYYE